MEAKRKRERERERERERGEESTNVSMTCADDVINEGSQI